MASPPINGLRVSLGLAGLLLVIAVAWLVQKRLVNRLQEDRGRAMDLLSEGAPPQPFERGWGKIRLGAPSGAAPRPRSALATFRTAPGEDQSEPQNDLGARAESTPIALPRWPADLELVVRSGQSLSKIAAAKYGQTTDEILQRLASYNRLEDPDKLRIGQRLNLPALEKLLAND